jgi:hypothetical protein
MSYRIVRNYFDSERAPERRVVKRGLTLEEARAHCKDPETSSTTAKSATARAHTAAHGSWFDGFDEE